MSHNAQIPFRTIRGVLVLTMGNATSTATAVMPNLRTVFVASVPATATPHAILMFDMRTLSAYLGVLVASNVKKITDIVRSRRLASFTVPKIPHVMMATRMAIVTSPRVNAHSHNRPHARMTLLLHPRPHLYVTTPHSVSSVLQSTSLTKQAPLFRLYSHALSWTHKTILSLQTGCLYSIRRIPRRISL